MSTAELDRPAAGEVIGELIFDGNPLITHPATVAVAFGRACEMLADCGYHVVLTPSYKHHVRHKPPRSRRERSTP